MSRIIWLTGQSGAGKTTIADLLKHEWNFIHLDGDDMRECWDIGFSREERREHNLRIARLAGVFSREHMVLVSVIAPMAEVREEIDKICSPNWVYVKRTLPEREGHFYEEPKDYFTLDHDKLNVEESFRELDKQVPAWISPWQLDRKIA